jgi:hypothetical protein
MTEEDIQSKKEELADLNEDMIFYDGLEPALIGAVRIFNKTVALYDYEKCIDHLIERDGSDYESVVEYLEFNTLGSYVGDETPGFFVRTESFYEKGTANGGKKYLRSLSEEERMEVFSEFCPGCMRVDPLYKCHCQNDE